MFTFYEFTSFFLNKLFYLVCQHLLKIFWSSVWNWNRTHLFHVRIDSGKYDWKSGRKDEKNKLANSYGSVAKSFLNCTFHFLRMNQIQTIFFHFQKIAQFSGPSPVVFIQKIVLCSCSQPKVSRQTRDLTDEITDTVMLRQP